MAKFVLYVSSVLTEDSDKDDTKNSLEIVSNFDSFDVEEEFNWSSGNRSPIKSNFSQSQTVEDESKKSIFHDNKCTFTAFT